MRPTDRPEVRALRAGLEGHASAVVTEAMTAPAVGSGSVAVYATPSLAALMEQAAVACVEPHLAAGEASLGVHLDLSHTAASPPGERVSARATLTGVEGRKLSFLIEAWDSIESIGKATHTRIVVDVARFRSKLAAKCS